jgi:hypothetical protein
MQITSYLVRRNRLRVPPYWNNGTGHYHPADIRLTVLLRSSDGACRIWG